MPVSKSSPKRLPENLRRAFGLLAWACLFAFPVSTRNQVRAVQVLRIPGPAAKPSPAPRSEDNVLVPPSDRDAETWLKRAAEAATRGDWKLAADTLERVIDQHGDRTVTLDEGQHYYSAIHLAQAQIADWPADGLAAYRVLYDPEAKRLLAQARRDHDLDALREIARKYPHTTPAPKAMNLLIDWLLDRRQAGEAVELLARLAKLPDGIISQADLLTKQAVAYTLANERARAAQAIKQMRKLGSAKGPSLPKDWPQKVESIQRFFEDAKLDTSHERAGWAQPQVSADWPQPLGPAQLHGQMPSVRPVLAPEVAQTAPLPGAGSLNLTAVRRVIQRQGRPPVWQAVSDGRRLFVTCPSGLVARDLATFDFLWQAFVKFRRRDPAVIRHRIQAGMILEMNRTPGSQKNHLDRLATDTLFHEYRGEVSTAFGLVFVIEQDGTPGEQRPTLQGVMPASPVIDPEDLSAPNTLRAYEADTGRAVWTKGRGGPRQDVLKFAHFEGTPVAVGSYLVVPYIHRADLLLAVLKPDGSLVKQLLLGTGRAGMFPINGTLQPTVYDGTLYVPTGAGLLLALNAYDFSLRWLASYERSASIHELASQKRRGWVMIVGTMPQADEWLSSPPVVAGGKVLMAPHDAASLFAFDPQNGTEQWAFPRGEHRYIVGADDQRVILAGRTVEAVDLATGVSQWRFKAAQPSGRPAICGQEVLVPTEEGLIHLDLATGEPLGDLSPAEEPLGNLLAIDGSLVSVGADRIAKFPDPDQSRALAEARLAKDPNDVEALIRLARLTMLTKDWQAALALLDQAESKLSVMTTGAPGGTVEAFGVGPPPSAGPFKSSGRTPEELRGQIAHQRVVGLLNAAADATAQERESLLRRAAATAERPGDRVEAGLALIESLAEQHQVLAAFQQALALLGQTGRQSMRLDAHLRARAGVLIGERLHRFWGEMNAAQRRKASGQLDSAAAQATAAGSHDALVQLADCFGFLAFGARLDLALGRRAIERGEIETGVFFLERAAARPASRSVKLEALVRLARVYRDPGEGLPAASKQAAAVLRRLSTEFMDETLPAGLSEGSGKGNVRAFVARMKSSLPAGLFGDQPPMPRILQGARRLGLWREDPVPDGMVTDGASFWDPTRGRDLYAQVLPMEVSGQIRGVRLGGQPGEDAYYWAADLDSDSGMAVRIPPSTSNVLFNARDAAIAGEVAVLRTRREICGLGLMSGRLMWPPLAVEEQTAALPEPSLVNAGGIIIAAVDGSTLVAMAARDDDRPLWRRRWPLRRLKLLRVVAGQLVVVDRGAEKAFVLDPRSGRIRREYWLLVGKTDAEPKPVKLSGDDPDAHVAIVGGVIWRSGEKVVVGRDVATGTRLWRIELDGLVKGLFELDGRHLGISYGVSRFRVVESKTGEVVKDLAVTGLVMPPQDAVVDFTGLAGHAGSGRLLLFTRTDTVPAEYILASSPLDGVEKPWRLELGQFATISRQMMRASPDYVAVIRNEVAAMDLRQAVRSAMSTVDQNTAPRLEVVHKQTGRRLGPLPYEFDEGVLGEMNGHRSRLITDVIVLDRRIVAVAPEGYFVLADRQEVGSDD